MAAHLLVLDEWRPRVAVEWRVALVGREQGPSLQGRTYAHLQANGKLVNKKLMPSDHKGLLVTLRFAWACDEDDPAKARAVQPFDID